MIDHCQLICFSSYTAQSLLFGVRVSDHSEVCTCKPHVIERPTRESDITMQSPPQTRPSSRRPECASIPIRLLNSDLFSLFLSLSTSHCLSLSLTHTEIAIATGILHNRGSCLAARLVRPVTDRYIRLLAVICQARGTIGNEPRGGSAP